MELTSIQIQNYRSIEDITIEVRDRCLIFLGINESGKSNILKAISAISDEFKFAFSEDSKIPVKEGRYEFAEPTIHYNFKLSECEKTQIIGEAFGENYVDWPIKYNSKHYNSTAKFIDKLIGEAGYLITLKKDNTLSNIVYYSLPEKNYDVKDFFYCCKSKITVNVGGTSKVLASGEIVNQHVITDFDSKLPYFDKLMKKHVEEKVSQIIGKYVKENLPKVILWHYNQSYLLDSTININSFKSNPEFNS